MASPARVVKRTRRPCWQAQTARAVFAGNSTLTWIVVVDEYDRPTGLVDRHGRALQPLSVLPAEQLADVARRIATRPPSERHAPVVLCDERARLIGLMTVERLLGRLADAIESVGT